jgi:hypothetical protein
MPSVCHFGVRPVKAHFFVALLHSETAQQGDKAVYSEKCLDVVRAHLLGRKTEDE